MRLYADKYESLCFLISPSTSRTLLFVFIIIQEIIFSSAWNIKFYFGALSTSQSPGEAKSEFGKDYKEFYRKVATGVSRYW